MKTRARAICAVHLRALPFVGLTLACPALALEGFEPAGSGSQLSNVLPPALSATAPGASTPGRTGWYFVPTLSVLETLTDNVALAPADRRQSDWVTTIAPGIQINGVGARTMLNLRYRANGLFYANNSASNDIQNDLDATGRIEAIDKWLFLEGSGRISQEPLSAFGSQPTARESINNNRVETRTWQLSPYVVGRFGTVADYQLRYRATTTDTSRGSLGENVDTREWTGSLTSAKSLASFNWSLNASTQDIHGDRRRDLTLSVVRGLLIYNIYPRELSLTGILGQEANNYAQPETEYKTIYGMGFEWTPSPRTQVSAVREQRFFGDAYNYSVRYRTPLSAWRYVESREVTVTPSVLAAGGRGTAYDILFDSLTSRFPDPLLRAQETERVLREGGIPPDLLLGRALLTNRAFVLERREASAAILGVRNTITFTAGFSKSRTIEAIPTVAPDDFSLTPEVTQRALSIDWAHKVSALTSLNVLASRTESTGVSATTLETTQSLVRILVSHKLGPRATAVLGARLQRLDSTLSSSYREKAITGALTTEF